MYSLILISFAFDVRSRFFVSGLSVYTKFFDYFKAIFLQKLTAQVKYRERIEKEAFFSTSSYIPLFQ